MMRSTDSSAHATRPVLLLDACSRSYREHPLQRILVVHPVVLMDSEPSTWATPYLRREVTVDLADTDALAVAVKQLISTPLAGAEVVLSSDEPEAVEVDYRVIRALGREGLYRGGRP